MKRITITLLVCAISSAAFADTATEINSANALLRGGKIDEALATYQNVTADETNKDGLNYNVGVAQYRKGDLESAKALFTEAATSTDNHLASAARYNLGNCHYADAVAAAENDKHAAIESLAQAIENYRASLIGNPNHADARANIELAVELLKTLKQEEEQQQQNQDQQSQDQQNQDQQNQDQQNQDNQDSTSDDQQSSDQQSKQDQSQSGENSSDQQQSESEEQSSKQEQSQDESEESQDSDNQSGKYDQPKPDQSAQESDAESQQQSGTVPASSRNKSRSGDQQQAEHSDEEPQAEGDDKPIPSGELKAASEQESNEAPNGRAAMEDLNAKDAPMSKEEAFKMLQAVRDRDMLRRLRQEQVERSRHITTDKDW